MIDVQAYKTRHEKYFKDYLIPFWATRVEETEFGGFQSNFDKDGNPAEIQEKSFLAQARILFSIAFVENQGFTFPDALRLIEQGCEFLDKYFFDSEHGGYYWLLEKDGSVIEDSKIIYGHSFLLYAFTECQFLHGTKHFWGKAEKVFNLIREKAVDKKHGGYIEHFWRDFKPRPARGDVGCHKSLDVHMHLMEAFTNWVEMYDKPHHREALDEVVALIHEHMIDPETGTGIAMFNQKWKPIANVELDIVWGADRFDKKGKSADITSYGHNIELAWLYVHMMKICRLDIEEQLPWLTKIYDHTYEHGVDWENGGLYCEGHKTEGVTESNKEFWQQCEGMVGFLDAYLNTRDEKYLDAYANIQDFVFDKMINWDLGEYLPLLDKEGKVLWDYMSTNWKICYHSLRASALVVRKLETIHAMQAVKA